MMPEPLHSYFKTHSKTVDSALDKLMDRVAVKPELIHEAMRYSIFAGGKRLRPVLVIAGAECCGKSAKDVLPAACAMELIHTYSLVHDDLPAMDDDDLRRGRPTNHKVYGEAIAILAGDALVTKAFELIAQNGKIRGIKPQSVNDAVLYAAKGAGTFGMIGGQVVDIQMEGGRWKKQKSPLQVLDYIHYHKTAALIRASLEVGAALAGGSKKQLDGLREYGEKIGLAFQIADDVLDIVADKKKLGKKGSDKANQKLTYPALFGIDKSRQRAQRLVEEAKAAVSVFGKRSQVLKQLANYIIERDH